MSPFSTRTLRNLLLIFGTVFSTLKIQAQVTLAFQGGEPGDTWTYSGATASGLALSEATLSPNKVTGTRSIVAGGDIGGGNCIAGTGSGNTTSSARTFNFSDIDITTSNQSTRTLTFNWGNRFPACTGTGWDSDEDLIFIPIFDGVPQAQNILANGNNNAQFSIQTHSFTFDIPACVDLFGFTVFVTTNRADELLFLDNVTLTAPQLNTPMTITSPISGPTQLCQGSTATYSIQSSGATSYSWFGLPAGASFTTPTNAASVGVNWGTAPVGTYTLSVAPIDACGNEGTPVSITVNIVQAANAPTISGPTTMCPGEIVTLTSSEPGGNTWSTGATTQSISVSNPGTYTLNYISNCGSNQNISHIITLAAGPEITSVDVIPVSCFGMNDGQITVNTPATNVQYSINNQPFQGSNTFTNLAPGNYTIELETAAGCSSSTQAEVTSPNALTVAITPVGSICSGASIQLNASSNGGSGTQYSWSGPNNFNAATQSISGNLVNGDYTVIAQSGGCSATISYSLAVHLSPEANFSSDVVCEGVETIFNSDASVAISPSSIEEWHWNFGNGETSTTANPNYEYPADGSYIVTLEVVDNNGCSDQTIGDVTVLAKPTADFSFSPLEISASDPEVTFTNTSVGGTIYNWSFGVDNAMSTEISPVYLYPSTTADYSVQLVVENEFGCSDSISRTVSVGSGLTYYVPNSFTPNGDGVNDDFGIVMTEGFDLANVVIRIYNRWGEEVFSMTDVSSGWNGMFKGEKVPEGTYVWEIYAKHLNDDGWENFQGHVVLLR